jgi:site-specific recombinase XerD
MGKIREQMMMVMQMRNFSAKTIKSYIWQVKAYVQMFGKSPAEMGQEEVKRYMYSLVERKASSSTVRVAYSALKFLYKDTLQREWKAEELPRPKREKRLPVVLSGEEVKRIFDAVENLKHRMVLMSCYSAGLRISEAVHLKVTDIDSQRMQIRVEQGKGKKDRYTLLAGTMLGQLRTYWKLYCPRQWLFAGRSTDRALTVSSVQRAFVRAKKKLELPSLLQSIVCAIALRLTFWSLAQTFSPSRSFSVIQA